MGNTFIYENRLPNASVDFFEISEDFIYTANDRNLNQKPAYFYL